jgi:hypothetical protein
MKLFGKTLWGKEEPIPQPIQTPAAKKKRATKSETNAGAEPTKKPRKSKAKSDATEKSNLDKIAATKNGQPYVQVLGIELDAKNPRYGSFTIDWNEYFIIDLKKAGYEGKDDQTIVDRWFSDICRHVVLETYEQEQANYPGMGRRVQTKILNDGRSEHS